MPESHLTTLLVVHCVWWCYSSVVTQNFILQADAQGKTEIPECKQDTIIVSTDTFKRSMKPPISKTCFCLQIDMLYTCDYRLLGKDLRDIECWHSCFYIMRYKAVWKVWLILQWFLSNLKFFPKWAGYGPRGGGVGGKETRINLNVGKSSFILLLTCQFLYSMATSL